MPIPLEEVDVEVEPEDARRVRLAEPHLRGDGGELLLRERDPVLHLDLRRAELRERLELRLLERDREEDGVTLEQAHVVDSEAAVVVLPLHHDGAENRAVRDEDRAIIIERSGCWSSFSTIEFFTETTRSRRWLRSSSLRLISSCPGLFPCISRIMIARLTPSGAPRRARASTSCPRR